MNKCSKDILALNFIPGLGPKSLMKLLSGAKDAEMLFSMEERKISEILGRRFKWIEKIKSVRESEDFKKELSYIEEEKLGIISFKDKDYPESLLNIYDPPPVLYVKGSLGFDMSCCIAIVGSRKCSSYGLRIAEELAYELASKGIVIVSGMARGIDSAAHKGALKAGGRTIAVMGSGFKHVYPPESKSFIEEVSRRGAVITEYPSCTRPAKGTFPRRNRIISGLSRGVIVAEAAKKSGAMITVDFALEQGKEVFAVPGRPDAFTSGGTNALIQSGAKLITNAGDVLEELNACAGA